MRQVFLSAMMLAVASGCGGSGSTSDAALPDEGIDARAADAGRDGGVDAMGTDAMGTDADAADGAPVDGHCATDADGDGHASIACGGDDCDDADPARYPGNTEVCDATGHDEDCNPSTFGFLDADGDGVASATCCNTNDATGAMTCGTDCDDGNSNVHPAQTETCNGIDDNCDGMVDEGVTTSYTADCDGDHFGAGAPMVRCTPPSTPPSCVGGAWVAVAGDCDDADLTRFPTNPEVCDPMGHDEDCDPTTFGTTDADGDGFVSSGCCDTQADASLLCGPDCDDARSVVHPGATEVCNGADDDCNGMYDEGLTGCAPAGNTPGFVACDTMSCDLTTARCCASLSTAMATCEPTATACPASEMIPVVCDGPDDCAVGERCVVTSISSPVPSCSRTTTPGMFILCHLDLQCPPTQHCAPFASAPWLSICGP